MDNILYGAAYYTEYMPYDRLEQDAQLMQQAGLTVVRMGESSWGLWEPQDGRFEFDGWTAWWSACTRLGSRLSWGHPPIPFLPGSTKASGDRLSGA